MNTGTVSFFKLDNIDREEPTDFPLHHEDFETTAFDVKSFAVEFFMNEQGLTSEEAHEKLYDLAVGADGALEGEEDMDGFVLVRYSLAS